MDIHIRPDSPWPLHVQLGEQLKSLIEARGWVPMQRLPTVRSLSAALGVNYNTVRSVYQALEREGYVATGQGRGTFVAAHPPGLPERGRADLVDRIDSAVLAAGALRVPPDMLARAVRWRARALSSRPVRPARILFAECNRPDLDFHAREIARATGVAPDTMLLAGAAGRGPADFADYDVIATPLVHLPELRAAIGVQRSVLGLVVTPSVALVLDALARERTGAVVGLVCVTGAYARRMRRALVGAGVGHVRFATAGMDQPERLGHVVERSEVLYVSRMGLDALRTRRARLPHAARGGPAIRPYVTELDPASLRLLRRAADRPHTQEGA